MSNAHGIARLPDLPEFDTLIDVRSPAEFAEDHIPGAINCPVLDNEERARVGTIYKQVSPFEARKIGGALVAKNIARHLETRFLDKPRGWRPLIYCWRGGQRSGSFSTWMRMVGWDACQLAGGYKTYRHSVIERINTLPAQFRFIVVCGATGSAKTRLLEALATEGAQVLDLEDLACHKGSVLGAMPGRPQPNQKFFETGLCQKLAAFDPQVPVFVEAESRKIGRIQVPEPLIEVMRASECVAIEATREARLEFLLRDYAYLGDDVAQLQSRIAMLKGLQSNETIARWHEQAAAGNLADLFAGFIDDHYDPHYQRSQNRNFPRFADAVKIPATDLKDDSLRRMARDVLSQFGKSA
ncbi:MAG TPA: tRNA 2-selenouridine(34) synthase MnmH [Rhodocyclaceae bacterium]|nr:tRNA 2-selenouridine(34) synthase MnmH [Rhodocyclaceae bacterium]